MDADFLCPKTRRPTMSEEEIRKIDDIWKRLGLPLFPDVEEETKPAGRAEIQTQYIMREKPVKAREWGLLYAAVQVKKGPMSGDEVDNYLKSCFEVSDLRFVTRSQFESLLRQIFSLPFPEKKDVQSN